MGRFTGLQTGTGQELRILSGRTSDILITRLMEPLENLTGTDTAFPAAITVPAALIVYGFESSFCSRAHSPR
jgi:hypothetical protein